MTIRKKAHDNSEVIFFWVLCQQYKCIFKSTSNPKNYFQHPNILYKTPQKELHLIAKASYTHIGNKNKKTKHDKHIFISSKKSSGLSEFATTMSNSFDVTITRQNFEFSIKTIIHMLFFCLFGFLRLYCCISRLWR